MNDETYNGWSNRETWAIQLHLSNNEGDYRAMTEEAERLVDETDQSIASPVALMADHIMAWTEEVFTMVTHPDDFPPTEAARLFVADVGSWWRADFYEIAQAWIDAALESVAS